MFPKEERILAWKKIPESSRILFIASIIVIIFLTPNLAEGYESTWNKVNINSNNEIENLAIYDILGKEVFSQKINNINSILNIEHFINGVYFLKLNFKDATFTTVKISKE